MEKGGEYGGEEDGGASGKMVKVRGCDGRPRAWWRWSLLLELAGGKKDEGK